MRKVVLCTLIWCVFWLGFIDVKAEDKTEEIIANHYYVMDQNSGNVLLEKDSQAHIDPASITKIMTAVIVVENTRNFDRLITLTQSDLAYVEEKKASRVGFMEVGDQLTINDALYGLLLASGGDCGMMLSHSVTGTTQEFVDLMNLKAEQLGLQNTHFSNTLGVIDDAHYSSAEDIAKILQYAMKNERLRAIMGTDTYTLQPTLSKPIEIAHSGHVTFNQKKVSYANILASKTGYEVRDGHCLAAMAEKEDKQIIAVVVGSGMEKEIDESAKDVRILLDRVFAQTQNVEVDLAKLVEERKLDLSSVSVAIQEPVHFLVDAKLDPSTFTYTYEPFAVSGTVHTGTQIGNLHVQIHDDFVVSVPLIAASTSKSMTEIILYACLLLVGAGFFMIQHKRHQAVLKKGGNAHGSTK